MAASTLRTHPLDRRRSRSSCHPRDRSAQAGGPPGRPWIAALLLLSLSACAAPVAAQQVPQRHEPSTTDIGEEPLRLDPPPPVADEYRDFCRGQPAGCGGNYQRYQAPFREGQMEQRLDRLRERGLRQRFPPDRQ